MSFDGLPDFGRALEGAPRPTFPPWEDRGPWLVVPDALEVGLVAGRPDFALEFVRGRTPDLPPKPHALLTAGLVSVPLDEATRATIFRLLGGRRRLALLPPPVRAGFIVTRPQVASALLPGELLRPLPMEWDGLHAARLRWRLSPEAGLFLRDALRAETAPIAAEAHLWIAGVAPRLERTVTFDPRAMVARARAGLGPNGHLAPGELESALLADADAIVGGPALGADAPRLAAALAARLLRRFAAPAVDDEGRPGWQLSPEEEVHSGRFEWDLAQPDEVLRPFTARLDPLSAAAALAASEGIDAVVHERTVPNLPSGTMSIEVAANLPRSLHGVLALGVDVEVPANPPVRPAPAAATLDLTAPDHHGEVRLTIARGESPEYRRQTFVLLRSSRGVDRRLSDWKEGRSPRLYLSSGDFAARFVPVSLRPDLAALADAVARVRWTAGGALAGTERRLSPEDPVVTFALPDDAVDVSVEVELLERAGERSLTLGPWTAAAVELTPYSLPQLGAHEITVQAGFGPHAPAILRVSLVAEDRADDPDAVTTVALTARRPAVPFRWRATSPFAPGYRYRVERHGDGEAAPWSAPRSPFDDLEVAPMTDSLVLHGLRLERDPEEPTRFYYEPAALTPECTPAGRPNLMVIEAGPMTIFQLGVRWVAEDAAVERARVALAQQLPELGEPPQLVAAHAQVRSVRLEVVESEEWRTVATGRSSGFSPHTAVLNASLTGAAEEAAKRAAAGEEGRARVVYEVTLSRPVDARARLTGDLSASLAAVMDSPTVSAARSELAAAIREGWVKIERPGAHVPEALARKLEDTLESLAATLLVAMAEGRDRDTNAAEVEVAAAERSMAEIETTVVADIATWMSRKCGAP